MASAIPIEVNCASSLLNAGVVSKSAPLRARNFQCQCHFWSEVYSMIESEPKDLRGRHHRARI